MTVAGIAHIGRSSRLFNTSFRVVPANSACLACGLVRSWHRRRSLLNQCSHHNCMQLSADCCRLIDNLRGSDPTLGPPHPFSGRIMKSIAAAVLVAALVAAAPVAQAQEVGAPAGDAPRVFLDCSYFCDQNFINTEINWVNWVRDQADAQVHILRTQQPTGGGGSQYAFNF